VDLAFFLDDCLKLMSRTTRGRIRRVSLCYSGHHTSIIDHVGEAIVASQRRELCHSKPGWHCGKPFSEIRQRPSGARWKPLRLPGTGRCSLARPLHPPSRGILPGHKRSRMIWKRTIPRTQPSGSITCHRFARFSLRTIVSLQRRQNCCKPQCRMSWATAQRSQWVLRGPLSDLCAWPGVFGFTSRSPGSR